MKANRILMSCVVFLSFVITSQASAFDTFPTLDAPPIYVGGVSNGDVLGLVATNGRSYCCGMNNPFATSSSTGGNFTTFTNFGTITPTYRGSQIPRISGGGSSATNRRYCWAESDSPNHASTRTAVLGNISGSVNIYVSCEETTLYGNYNTSVSEFNFLELTARSSGSAADAATVTGTITFKSSITGNKTTTPLELDFSSSTGTSVRTDISVHDLLGNVADFGEIYITHDGAPGQLTARLSQYDVTSTSPLNFVLVGHADLRRGLSK